MYNIKESVCGRNYRRVAAVYQSICYIILLHTEIDFRPSSCGIPTTHNIVCVYNIFNVMYTLLLFTPYGDCSFLSCGCGRINIIYFVLSCHDCLHTHTAYTYLLYEPSTTYYCVYRTDMITYYYYCHRVYDEQRVAKTTVAPHTRRIKESCTRNPSKRGAQKKL